MQEKQFVRVCDRIGWLNFMDWMDQRERFGYRTADNRQVTISSGMHGWNMVIGKEVFNGLSMDGVIGMFIRHEIGYFT